MNTSCDLEISAPPAADLHPLPAVAYAHTSSFLLCHLSASPDILVDAQASLGPLRRIKREDEVVEIRRQMADHQDQKSLSKSGGMNPRFLLIKARISRR